MTGMSAVDELKQVRLLLKEKLDVAHDMLAGGGGLEEVHDLLDAAFFEVDEAVARHTADPSRFEDGSPVKVTVRLREGYVADYYPRLHGDYVAWKAGWEAHCRPALYPVPNT